MFIQYEKELDERNQIIKVYEFFIGDDKIKNDVLNEVFKKIKELKNSEKDGVYKNNSITNFIKILNNKKRELQSKKKILWK